MVGKDSWIGMDAIRSCQRVPLRQEFVRRGTRRWASTLVTKIGSRIPISKLVYQFLRKNGFELQTFKAFTGINPNV